jgi:hypothetical protein
VKKVFPILMAFIIFVLPFGGLKAFAYSGGLLDGKTLNLGGSELGISSFITNVTDNNVSTGTTIQVNSGSNNDTLWGSFTSPVTINSYKFVSTIPNGIDDYLLKFYDSDGILLKSMSMSNSNGSLISFTAVPNVSKVAIFNVSTASDYTISEFDVFGPSAVTHTEINNFVATANNNSVSLTYDIPSSNADFTGSKIYRDGVLISSQNSGATSFQDNGLTYSTSYSYKVTATYSDGFETSGAVSTLSTGAVPVDPATIPPSNVTSLMVSDLTGTGAKLNWSNSTDTDLASVNIYLDGLVVANVPLTSSYVLTGLTASTQYNYGVALVDNDGNVSSIVSTVFTTLEFNDSLPPEQVKGVSADAGNSALYVKWSANTDSDLSGYNVYIDGVKFNTSVIKNTFLTVTDLVNDQSYDVQVSAVDLSGNEGAKSSISSGIPLASKLPLISMDYTLSDVADAVSSWFASQWLILAFAISIPLSFYIASRVKLLFLD